MKMITAIIDPDKLVGVRDALKQAGVEYLILMSAKASAVEGGFVEHYRGNTYTVDYYDFARVDIAVADDTLEAVIEAIRVATASGKKTIGRLFVSTVDEAINLSTGKTGAEAV